MPTHVDNLRAWFDAGRAMGADYMLILHYVASNTDVPEYVWRYAFAGLYQFYTRDPSLIILEIYDLHDNREVQMWEHRAWHPPREEQP